jgi:hypothetical protein
MTTLEPFWAKAAESYSSQVEAAAPHRPASRPTFQTTRVSQLDAHLLDAELENVLTEPLLRSLKLFGVCLRNAVEGEMLRFKGRLLGQLRMSLNSSLLFDTSSCGRPLGSTMRHTATGSRI